jgi:hypothetical protein
MIDLRSLQQSIDASREASTLMNEAWCTDSTYARACKLADAEQSLVSALKAIRNVRTPIQSNTEERRAA